MFPFNLFKKKKEFPPLEEDNLDLNQNASQELNTFSNRPEQNYSSFDKQDLILSKLDAINAKIENMTERLKKIEELAK